MKSHLFRLTMLMILCLISLTLFGQDTSSITGTVRDISGAVVPGAEVTVMNIQTNVATKVSVNSAGDYVVRTSNRGSIL